MTKLLRVILIVCATLSLAHAQQPFQLSISSPSPNNYTLSWPAANLRPYQLESSLDLLSWADFGSPVIGTGGQAYVTDGPLSDPKKFYRLRTGAVRRGFDQFFLDRNDDFSTELVPVGFTIFLFGKNETQCYVNNNGNVTFSGPLGTYTPAPLQDLGFTIIAPFWADVDTRPVGSDLVRYSYGVETVNGHSAFGVNWVNVGYYSYHDDKLNSFQLVFIQRTDTGTGNFDIEFNYNQILWETGDASSGSNGYGGFPSRSGLTNGSNRTIELAYSGQTLVQLDANPFTGVPNTTTGLIYRSRNSTIPGRFVFQVRSGVVLGALAVNAGPDQTLGPGVTTTTLAGTASDPGGGTVTFHWSVLQGPSDVTFSNANILNPTVTIPTGETTVLQLTATSVADPSITAADIMQIN